MRLVLCENYEEMSKAAAKMVASQIIIKPDCVLGFATGSTPVGMYRELCRMYEAGELDFSGVTTFNLDEYYPIAKDNPESYHVFMEENLFSKVNVPREAIHIPDGSAADPEKVCRDYEAAIEKAGGIDLQILGIGQNGHIGFNEPDASLDAKTHVTELTESTIEANSRFFDNNVNKVPKTALTVGVGTVLSAKEVMIIVNGHNKALALYHAVEGAITQMWTISALQMHEKGIIVADDAATFELKVGTYRYFKDIEADHLDPASLLK